VYLVGMPNRCGRTIGTDMFVLREDSLFFLHIIVNNCCFCIIGIHRGWNPSPVSASAIFCILPLNSPVEFSHHSRLRSRSRRQHLPHLGRFILALDEILRSQITHSIGLIGYPMYTTKGYVYIRLTVPETVIQSIRSHNGSNGNSA